MPVASVTRMRGWVSYGSEKSYDQVFGTEAEYSDMFDWIERYFRLQSDGDLAAFVWAPHNAHHMAWTFLILLGDIRAFGAASGLFLAVGCAALVVMRPLVEVWNAAPVCISMKQPVP